MNERDAHDDNTRTHLTLINGSMVQHYRIVEKIGAGGMGEVYLAQDTRLDRQVALKFLPSHLATNDEVKTRFRREAQAVAKLNHPNIVTIHEVSDHMGRPFFVMEHIAGRTLHSFAHKEQLAIDDVIEYAIQICQGLGEAHRNGIVHRDIKAANIALDSSNRIRLLDFGLAATQGDEKLTRTGSTLGTVAYMSPEQISGRPIDRRSDLFSFGVVLYELLAGRTPFRRDNEGATLKAIIEEAAEPLGRYKANVPDKLQEIISKLLEKEAELRYQTAEGVIADLKKLLYDSQSSRLSKSVPSRAGSRKWLAPVIAASAVVVMAAGYLIFGTGSGTTDSTQPVLVVLPFDNLGSEEDEYFSDGIRDEIGARLSAVRDLRVISARSADRYKDVDKSIMEIGQETGADYVLEATIRWDKSGEVDRIRITPRLTKTSDNYLMWADNYEQTLVQIFDVQSDIADKIVTALGLTLIEPDEAAPEYAPTKNMAAYNYYLRGLEISRQSAKMSEFLQSIQMYDSATILDPNFALAWAAKSIEHSNFNFFFTTVDSKHHKERAYEAAQRALELDPDLPFSQIALGTYYNYAERDYDRALESFQAVWSETSSNADLSEAIGVVRMRQGKWQEALANFEEAIRIDPLSDRRYYYISNCLSMTRDYEQADQYINRALVLDPTNTDAAFMKVMINLLRNGSLEYGSDTFSKLARDAGLAEISTYELASSTSLGLWRYVIDQIDPEEALEGVRQLGRKRGLITERSPHMIHLNIAQIYDLTDRSDSAQIHYDSARLILLEVIEQGDSEFHAHAELGLTYALMGEAELAIEAGQMAKELMSVDDCHW